MHTQSDFLTPDTSRFSVAFQGNARTLSRSCANCYGLYAKRQLIIPATIKAIYSRDNIYIYIKVAFYVFYKHDVLFIIFNMNSFYVLAEKAMNVCQIC